MSERHCTGLREHCRAKVQVAFGGSIDQGIPWMAIAKEFPLIMDRF